MLRWFLDGTRVAQLAADNRMSATTAYRYRDAQGGGFAFVAEVGQGRQVGTQFGEGVGNIQVISVPDGWPLWVSDVRPGREHNAWKRWGPARAVPGAVEVGEALGEGGSGEVAGEGVSEFQPVERLAAQVPSPGRCERRPVQADVGQSIAAWGELSSGRHRAGRGLRAAACMKTCMGSS